MTIDFLLKHTSIKDMEANTKLTGIWYGAIYYLIEFFVRRYYARKYVQRIIDDMLQHEMLKGVFLDLFKISISEDENFIFIPFDDSFPQEVKEQTEPEQLMTLAESYFIEGTSLLRGDSVIMSTYMMNNMFSTLAMITNANTPFILLESEHLSYIMAIKNNWTKVIVFAVLQLIVLAILAVLIKQLFTILI